MKIDPITFAIIKNALDTMVDDMAYAVMRTARSPIIRDVLDYSVTMCDAQGRILSQAKTVALHLGAVPDAVEVVMKKFAGKFEPGDVIILNDPYEGGMHLPDIFMFKPIFLQDELQGFSVVIAHHCDVGGRVPGSNAADSTEIFQEGLRISPTKLYARGVPNETLFDIIARNVRLPDLVFGDLDAQLATCNIGERELLRLFERYGIGELNAYFDELLNYGERLTRGSIAKWPQGSVEFTDYIDDDGFSPDPIPIRCKITVKGDHLLVDFTGSSPQVKGAINSTLSFVKSATYLSVRCALGADVPNNAGVYRCIDVVAPEGSILNPIIPAPVAARALTGYRVVDTVFGALAQIVPDKVMAAGEGGNTVVALSGMDPVRKTPFILVDMINGAWGGRADKDGIEGVTNPSQNMSNLPVETLEARYPVILEEYSYRPDSGGAGRFRGGLGLVRQYRVLADDVVAQVRSDRAAHAPYGLFGGEPGAVSRNVLNPDTTNEPLPSKFTCRLPAGSVIRHEQAGAGGFGSPLERSPEAIQNDVRNGKVTRSAAEAKYGVVFDGEKIVSSAPRQRLQPSGAEA
ncbi:5-oxoprolinase [Bordetella genomosp. 10]|uniref:5-oxoprolinase n=2 Tax=Bordetella genomosp. 10 TaxID=1416804 RepID=A0A261S2J3_9BORD|nr:5-oxoprolinase [Bordetella genomosp. 10]